MVLHPAGTRRPFNILTSTLSSPYIIDSLQTHNSYNSNGSWTSSKFQHVDYWDASFSSSPSAEYLVPGVVPGAAATDYKWWLGHLEVRTGVTAAQLSSSSPESG